MPSQTPQIVQRLWNFCDVLRDDGVSYGDYVEQLTYLLFLKMDQERRELGKESAIPDALPVGTAAEGRGRQRPQRRAAGEPVPPDPPGAAEGRRHDRHYLRQGTKPNPEPSPPPPPY